VTRKKFPEEFWDRPIKCNGHWAYWFYEPTYRENIRVIWPVNEEQRQSYITAVFGITDFSNEPPAFWCGRVSEILEGAGDKSGVNGHVLALHKIPKTSADLAVIAHETFHVANNILSRRGVVFDNSIQANNEAYAYLIEHLFTKIHRAVAMTRS
jgi:hypothetical protein